MGVHALYFFFIAKTDKDILITFISLGEDERESLIQVLFGKMVKSDVGHLPMVISYS